MASRHADSQEARQTRTNPERQEQSQGWMVARNVERWVRLGKSVARRLGVRREGDAGAVSGWGPEPWQGSGPLLWIGGRSRPAYAITLSSRTSKMIGDRSWERGPLPNPADAAVIRFGARGGHCSTGATGSKAGLASGVPLLLLCRDK